MRGSHRLAPALTCAGVIVLAGVLTALLDVSVKGWALDELLYRASAVHYSSGLPDTLIHDFTARATSRLYALLLMPLFATFDGDTAIRASKVFNVLLWCSTAVPLWLLARPLLTPWRRAAAVALGVVAPWIALTSVLFTENLAWPAFIWCALAATWAARRPAWWRDGVVLIAVGVAIVSRTQLFGIVFGYVALILLAAAPKVAAGGPWWWRVRTLGRHLRAFPFTSAGVLAVIVAFVAIQVAGDYERFSVQLFGGYAATDQRATWIADGFSMVFVEALAMTCGVGVIAVLFGAPWYLRTLGSGKRDDAWWFAAGTGCVSLGLLVFTAYAQGSYLNDITEERYWFYPYPFAWIAALAATQARSVRAGQVAIAGFVVAVIAGTLGSPRVLDGQSVFLAPVLGSLGSLTDQALDPVTTGSRDQLALILLVVTGLAWLAVRRAPWLRAEWLLAGGAAAQLALTAVPLLATDGHLVPAAQRTGAVPGELSWIDRNVSGPVTWLSAEPRRDAVAWPGWQRDAYFWNRRVTTRLLVAGSSPQPDANPLDALPQGVSAPDPGTGVLDPAPSSAPLVTWVDSPYLQVAGRELARSGRSGLAVVAPARPVRLTYRAQGLLGDDAVAQGEQVRLDVWPTAAGAELTLAFGPGTGAGSVVVRGGGEPPRTVAVPATGEASATLRLCGAHRVVTVRGRDAGPAPAEGAPAESASLLRATLRPLTDC